jgi:hypothetical protein
MWVKSSTPPAARGLTYVDLAAPGYNFLATDTPAVMRWLSGEVESTGAYIALGMCRIDPVRWSRGTRRRIARAAGR